ncbi:helix-turn-helix domain-containing protein [Chitinophaga rhizosphaerae]|uniref:helix-turn-helix domain-containing protein n=1 Tax=Chitinophaga rhizosphaerae TaxID=1864947 RepID=UPI000F8101BF|nr:helix-turn-helix domain-containing protein [Chitinophaga rhizosphaerae]
MLHIAGIIISIFLAFLLFAKKGKSGADFVLAIWLVVISFHLLCYHLLISGSYVGFPFFLGTEIPLPLVHGPFLYVYTALLTGQNNRRLPWPVHFLPAAVAFSLLSKFYLLPAADKIAVYENHGKGFETITAIIRLPIVPSGIIYVALSLMMLRKHRVNISKQFSYSEKINLDWLVYLALGMAAIWLSIIFGGDVSTFILVDLFVLFIGYFGIKQVGIFTNRVEPVPSQVIEARLPGASISTGTPNPGAEKTKYQKSAIGADMLSKIHQQLTGLMASEKLFTDPELNLDDLAARLSVNSNTLSQVINSLEQRNFYDYINDLRVQEFKRLAVLPENSRLTLLSIAYEAGFNSKTSFNRNFKKNTGISPREFCQQEKILPDPE